MTALAYTVTAILPDEDTLLAYVHWLQDGHVDSVIGGGAHSAMIVRIEDPAGPPTIQTRYVFSTRDDFDRYLAQHAPALRDEGLRRFGPETGVVFRREVGRVL